VHSHLLADVDSAARRSHAHIADVDRSAVDEIERSFGVTGAVALWVVGVALRSAA